MSQLSLLSLNLWLPRFFFSAWNRWQPLGEEFPWRNRSLVGFCSYEMITSCNLISRRTFVRTFRSNLPPSWQLSRWAPFLACWPPLVASTSKMEVAGCFETLVSVNRKQDAVFRWSLLRLQCVPLFFCGTVVYYFCSIPIPARPRECLCTKTIFMKVTGSNYFKLTKGKFIYLKLAVNICFTGKWWYRVHTYILPLSLYWIDSFLIEWHFERTGAVKLIWKK